MLKEFFRGSVDSWDLNTKLVQYSVHGCGSVFMPQLEYIVRYSGHDLDYTTAKSIYLKNWPDIYVTKD